MSLIELSFLSALVGFAFNKMLGPGMIFEFYKNFLDYIEYKGRSFRILHYMVKPLGQCIICNTTWIGFIVAFLLWPVHSFVIIVVNGLAAAGIVILLQNIFVKLQK